MVIIFYDQRIQLPRFNNYKPLQFVFVVTYPFTPFLKVLQTHARSAPFKGAILQSKIRGR